MKTRTFCKYGHRLTQNNKRIRKDRNNAIECKMCQSHGRRRFNERKPLYDIWKTMIRRCVDPTFKDWHLYGGKTPPITVCERWYDYNAFESDMGERPSKRHTIDRIDSTLGYFPENCRWATAKQQSRNWSSGNHKISFKGETLTIAEWSERVGLKYLTIFMRLKRGWSIEKTLSTQKLYQTQYQRPERDPKNGRYLPNRK